jgi:hypothetical protein
MRSGTGPSLHGNRGPPRIAIAGRLPGRRRAAMRHMKELGAGAVRSHHPGAQRDALGTSLDQESGRAIAKKDAGVGIVVGQVMRHRIAGDQQHALRGPGGDEAQRRDQAQNAARAGRVEVKGGYGPQLQGMRDSRTAGAQRVIRGKGGADQAVRPERRGIRRAWRAARTPKVVVVSPGPEIYRECTPQRARIHSGSTPNCSANSLFFNTVEGNACA